MTTLVLASGNAAKVTELADLLRDFRVDVRPQSDFAVPEVAETGASFVENALIKARHASRHTGLPVLADDSGLAVDYLRGAPGIYSARYSGPAADDAANRRKLLAALNGVPEQVRSARFICVLALLRHPDDPLPLICQGEWRGRIAHAERGHFGFGYDALFELPESGLTAAELAPEEKQRLSHRGRAMAQLHRLLADESVLFTPAAICASMPSQH